MGLQVQVQVYGLTTIRASCHDQDVSTNDQGGPGAIRDP